MTIRNIAPVFGLMALVLLACSPAVAQAPPAEPGATSAAENPEANLPVEELVRKGIETIDEFDREESAPKRQELVEQLQRYAGALQRKEPTNDWVDYFAGVLLAQGGRTYDAIESLREFVGSNTGQNYWMAHRSLGELFVSEFPALAKNHLREANRLKPNNASTLYALSRCEDKLGHTDSAINYARQAVDNELLSPRRKIAYQANFARMLLKNEQLDPALAAARQAIESARYQVRTNPGELPPLRILDAQYGVVADVLQAKLTADRSSGALYLEVADLIRGQAAVRQQIADFEALQVLEQGMANTQPNPPLTLLETYAKLLVEAQRLEDAADVYRQILERNPNHIEAKAFLESGTQPTGAPSP